MPDRREKTLSYRRADWLAGVPAGTTLESCLRTAHNTLKTVEDRTIIRDSGQCIRSVRKLAPHDGGIFIHLVTDTPGEKASVVPKFKKDTQELDVGVADAPEDAEFMDGDAFLYVNGDHVCLCGTGMRDGAIRQFLHEFFAKAKLDKKFLMFELMKAPKMDKLKMLKKEGIKEIWLGASLYQATTQYENRKLTTAGSLRSLANHIKKVIGAENDEIDDSMRVAIVIKTDERVRKHLKLGQARIEKLAQDVVKNYDKNDDFVIETDSGQRISADEIFISETVLIDSHGKSVKVQKAWESLSDFYKELKKSGALEQ